MSNWSKPDPTQLTPYLKSYVDKVPDGTLVDILKQNSFDTLKLLNPLSPEKLKFRYAEGKWSIPQILVHVMDTERIFAYRVLCIARGDKTPLPGYDENLYAASCNADSRNFKELMEEYSTVRSATLSLFKGLNDKMLSNTGTSNGKEISVKALCYVIAGHEIHHMNVVKERYL